VLFDGKPEADAQLAANAEVYKSSMAKEFELLSVPAGKTDRRRSPATIATGCSATSGCSAPTA
jgi:hypothetical protein